MKILDFGLAKLAGTEGVTQTGTTVGTVAYMSPEQARGEEVDHRTDVWSLGVVFYEMLTGQRPFQGENLLAISGAIQHDPPPVLTGDSSSLGGVVGRALHKSQSQRYQAVTELLDGLNATASTTSVVSRPDVPSIAVLPFANMSADPEQEYFCEGLAEELIDALARLQNLRVVSRTSAFQFRGKGHDLQQIAEKLKVKTVLEGSVRKAGNRLSVNAQLINAEDGYHLWSERYDRDMDDVFAVQDEIARSVVEKLKVKLLGEQDGPVISRPTDNLEAYNLFLEGRFHISRLTEGTIERGLACFTDALARDPGYARAHAGIAMVHSLRGWLSIETPRSAMTNASAAVQQALASDDALDEAHFASAYRLFYYAWDWDAAEREFQQTLRLNPNHAMAQQVYGWMLACLGRGEEGIRHAQRGVDLDPLSPRAFHILAGTYHAAGRFEEGIEQEQRALDLSSAFVGAFWGLSTGYMGLGELERSIESARQGTLHAPEEVTCEAVLAQALGLAGQSQEALQRLERLETRRRSRFTSPVCISFIYAGLNRVDEAMDWLATAHEERDPLLVMLNSRVPYFDPVRSHPRFHALLRRMNFAETAAPTS